MSTRLDKALEDASVRLSYVYHDLTIAASLSRGGSPLHKDFDDRVRAAAYIWIAATLERYIGDLITAISWELNALGIPRSSVRLSLFAVLCATEFESVKSSKKLKSFATQIGILTSTGDPARSIFGDGFALDGRTIRAVHFETLWLAFGIKRPCFPSLIIRSALEEVADKRNAIAHANEDPLLVARRRGTADMRRLLGLVEDLLLHTYDSVNEYLTAGDYKR